ncbi:hypothetical protein JOM56_010332 [Amanita muscaria]
MRAFGIFSIIAAFSAALSVSAVPVGASDLSLTPVVVRSVDVANGFANLRGAAQHADPAVPVKSREIAARTDVKSVPEILIGVTAQVKVVVDKLDVVLAGEIDVNVVVGLLVEIKGILIAAVADVKALVGLGLDVVLALDGKVLLVADVAVYVVALIQLIVAIVVKVQAVVTAAVAIQVCIDIR